ncbi:MAG: PGF-CTERM sorting domain-containing protein [Thermoplasmatales archaeon]|nr:PGF-CTERM sorting domain-containing protein [Thermoplasmatales archaeon]
MNMKIITFGLIVILLLSGIVDMASAGTVRAYGPISHDFGYMDEGETDSTDFEIWNAGTGTLTYSFSPATFWDESHSCSWVDLSPTSGSSTGERDTITVDIDTTDLSVGYHYCRFYISSNDVEGGYFTVDVNIVLAPPAVTPTPTPTPATPYIMINPVSSVVVGEELNLGGITNLADGTPIVITLKGPVEIPPKTVYVGKGAFKAMLDTTGATPGTYTVKADDEDGHTDEAIMDILKAVAPTPTPTPMPPEVTPTPTPIPTATPTPMQPPTPIPTSLPIATPIPTPTSTPVATKAPIGNPQLTISQTTLREEPEVGEDVLITVTISNTGDKIAKSINLREHIPSSVSINYVDGANSAGNLITWSGDLYVGQTRSIMHSFRILEEKNRAVPVKVTYEDEGGKKYETSAAIYISAKAEEIPAPILIPGFEVVFAIAGLLAVAYLIRRVH